MITRIESKVAKKAIPKNFPSFVPKSRSEIKNKRVASQKTLK